MIPKVTINVSEDTQTYYNATVPFVPVVIMKTMSGNIGTPELVRSESEFISKFGKGTVDTPSAYAMQLYMRSYSYAYVTRVADESAAKGTAEIKATIGETPTTIIDVETVYKTESLNGSVIALNYDSTDKKLYLTAVVNSKTYTSIKESIDLADSGTKAPDLEAALNKVCDSINDMGLGFTLTNLYTEKVDADPLPVSFTSLTATIESGDSGLDGTISRQTLLNAAELYTKQGLTVDVMVIPEFTSDTDLITDLAALGEKYEFMVLASPSVDTLAGALSEVAGYPKSSSLAVYFPNVKYTSFSAKIPACMAVLNAYARNDSINKWLAPAGTTRATLGLVSELCTNLNDDQMSQLYNNPVAVNCIKEISNTGYVVWGQKTTATSAIYLDRINVSRLVKYIYQEVFRISNQYLFEPITSSTFQGWNLKVTALLSSLETQGAISAFTIKMDAENNTPATIAENKLIGNIKVKPTEVAEFIDIDFVLTSEV